MSITAEIAFSPAGRRQPEAVLEDAPWLGFRGRWGSSVDAPAVQDWFFRAENPVSRTWLDQVNYFCRLCGRATHVCQGWRHEGPGLCKKEICSSDAPGCTMQG